MVDRVQISPHGVGRTGRGEFDPGRTGRAASGTAGPPLDTEPSSGRTTTAVDVGEERVAGEANITRGDN